MKKSSLWKVVNVLIFATIFCGVNLIATGGATSKQKYAKYVNFSFEQRELKDVLNEYAQMRGINILYPSDTQLTSKVSFNSDKKIPFKKAWELILLMLEQSGFSLISRGKNLYALVSTSKLGTTPLPIYINTSWKELPDSIEQLRYIYYFSNISVTQQQAELTAMLKNMFASQTFAQQVIFDTTANAIIMTARSEMIKSVMRILSVFDESGYQEAVKVVNLTYASASEVAQILTNLIGGQSGTQAGTSSSGRNFRQKKSANVGQATYFDSSTKVVSLGASSSGGTSSTSQLNTLVILGKEKDVDQVIDFIKHHLDVPLEKGKSFFHIIDLQWLPAADFAQLLTNLVTPSGGGQSTSVDLSDLAFDPQIKIVQETISQGSSYLNYSSSGGSSSGQNTLQRGSNRVVVAATQRDWERIQQVVKQIDIPQKQVIIEALVLDLDTTFARKLASQIRTRGIKSSVFPKNVQAQAGMLINSVLQTSTGESNVLLGETAFDSHKHNAVLEGDLSDIIYSMINGSTNESTNSTIMMIGDKTKTNGIWSFFQLVSLHQSTKVISRPFVISQNNKEAKVTSDVSKRLPGKVSSGVSPTVTYETKTAPVTVSFTPLISKNNSVNLQVNIDVTYWTDPSDGTSGSQIQRNLTTNFSLEDGKVAILGGLTKEVLTTSINEVPFISRVPILGHLFANKNRNVNKTQLFVLIKPTIVEPRKQGGMGAVTRRMVGISNHDLQADHSLFSSLKDPISRWIFDETEISNVDKDKHPTLHDLVVDTSLTVHAHQGGQDAARRDQLDESNKEVLDGFIDVQSLHDEKGYKKFAQKSEDLDMSALKNMLNNMNDNFPVLSVAK